MTYLLRGVSKITRKIKLVSIAILAIAGLATAGWYLYSSSTITSLTPQTSKKSIEQVTDGSNHGFFDVDFSQKMIVHHQQAVEMTDAILARSNDQAVREFALGVREAQLNAEKQYKGWISEWDETYTDLSQFPQTDGHDMYPSYPGLVSATEIHKLQSAASDDIDSMYILLLTKHHAGGINLSDMSNKFQYGKLIDFKNKVAADYKTEIKKMQDL